MNVKGDICLSRTEVLGNTQRKVSVIIYLRVNVSPRKEHDFLHGCKKRGVHLVGIRGEGDDAWEAVAAGSDPAKVAAALDWVTEHSAVRDWHFPFAVRIPCVSGGNGTATPRTERFIKQSGGYRPACYRSGIGKVEREAEAERDRRARLTADERGFLEMGEKAQRDAIAPPKAKATA